MKTETKLYRDLPSVDELLRSESIVALANREGQAAVADACRAALSRLRDEIKFNSVDALREQIGRDIGKARRYFALMRLRTAFVEAKL